MIYLGLAILGACSIGLLFKFSENRGLHRYIITAVNYLTASIISLVMAIRANLLPQIGMISGDGLLNRVSTITREGGVLPTGNSSLWAIIIGVMTGIFFLNAFIYYQKSIFENGIALSGMFSRLGVLIPMIISIIIWKEIPSGIHSIGITLAISAIVLANLEFEKRGQFEMRSSLIFLFLFSGVGIFCNKLFQKYALLEHKSIFLLIAFFTALLLALRIVARKKQGITPPDLVVGILVGSANLATNYFLVMALSRIKAAVVFPIYSAGSIIAMALGGVLIFRERLRPKDIFAICMTIIAIVLINL